MDMQDLVMVRCIVCQLTFCCGDCRWRHEKLTHGLMYDCPICRGNRFLCRPELLSDEFIRHLFQEHLPLQCKKCNKTFTKMEDFLDIDKCTTISELIDNELEVKKENNEVENRFNSLYEKVVNTEEGNFEAIVSVNKCNKTAIITPIVRKKHLVDYESSDTEVDSPKSVPQTPHPKLASKTPKLKRQRAATPHTKKYLNLFRQQVVEEYEEIVDETNLDGSPDIDRTTPCRVNNITIADTNKEITTPTSHIHVVKLAQAVTTSTPTHPVTGGWALFPEQGADSPLSEIENAENSAQSIGIERSKSDSDAVPVKLKSIIVTGSRIGLGSQDSSEKQVSFQDFGNNETSIKTKKVKFADDTVFQQEHKVKRVFLKPKRMLTPGPQKPRSFYNPRFQALLNRFEGQAITFARTPIITNREIPQEDTPPAVDHNLPARAISFKEDSPTVESRNNTKDSNDSFKTCIDSSDQPVNNAISALTTNIAGSLQTCLNSVLRTAEEETEIQFKFVITKRKVSVKRIVEDSDAIEEKTSEIEREPDKNKENIWSTVAKVVRNVFWGDEVSTNTTTSYKSTASFDSTSSSASKRKFEELSDSDVHGSWGLPAFICDVYIAMDVTSSTSSIFNLVAISVDRYIAVTQPIKYAKHKNNTRVWFTIVLVWLVSAAIGAPIVLGLNDTPDRNFDECLFNSQNYVLYSSLGSFYIPCIMMMFLYYNIFKALRKRAKKQRAAKKPPIIGESMTGITTAVVIENVAQTRQLETALDAPTNTGSGSNEDEHEDSFDKRSGDLEADADECHIIPNDKSTEFMLATVNEEAVRGPKRSFKAQIDPNGNNDSGYAPSNLDDTIREHVSLPGSPVVRDATVIKNMSCDEPKWRKNGKPTKTESDSRTASLALRSEEDLEASVYDVRDGSSCKKERKASAATARFTIYKANKASKKKREKSSAKKERKATKTLAIVLGVFLFCWTPFFTCNVLDAICAKFGLQFSPGVTVFILNTWLGYINSFLNPVIYTIFNPEFRKAFRKILNCST